MTTPYDATLKSLMEFSPTDWPTFVGLPATSGTIVDADISITSGASDKVFRVTAPFPYIFHHEFQASNDSLLPERILMYNALLHWRHRIPVESMLILLRPEANVVRANGVLDITTPGQATPYLQFRYHVIKVWEIDPETFLRSGLSLAALAPVSKVKQDQVANVLQRVIQRFESIPNENLREDIWHATEVLLDLRYDEAFIANLLNEVRSMQETTFGRLLKEQFREETMETSRQDARRETLELMRNTLLSKGLKKFGVEADATTKTQLEAITDEATLFDMAYQLALVDSWAELLAAPRDNSSPTES